MSSVSVFCKWLPRRCKSHRQPKVVHQHSTAEHIPMPTSAWRSMPQSLAPSPTANVTFFAFFLNKRMISCFCGGGEYVFNGPKKKALKTLKKCLKSLGKMSYKNVWQKNLQKIFKSLKKIILATKFLSKWARKKSQNIGEKNNPTLGEKKWFLASVEHFTPFMPGWPLDLSGKMLP